MVSYGLKNRYITDASRRVAEDLAQFLENKY
jgi:hypothetical protein